MSQISNSVAIAKVETCVRAGFVICSFLAFACFPSFTFAQPVQTQPGGQFRQPNLNSSQFSQPPQQQSSQPQQQEGQQQEQQALPVGELPAFSGEDAYQDLIAICELGPRISATEAMRQQQEMIETRLVELGAAVAYQRFNVVHPVNRQLVELQNMIVRWHPERTKRLVICCHYDTRPFADRDPQNPQGEFLGANDGASGVALLLELGKLIPHLEGAWGIDFIFFDGEEFVFVNRRDPMFLGSTFFAQEYAAGRANGVYSYGILVDMVADKNLEIYYEQNSLKGAPRLARSIWAVAKELGHDEFTAKKRHKIKDDHIPMNSIAKIPTIDIIDFDFPDKRSKNGYWHTQQDVPENCSAESLGIVGSVLAEWLIQLEQIR